MFITLLKLLIVLVLFSPSLLLTTGIWIFGGWTKGWDYMPNPTYKLLDWFENSI